MGSVQCASHRKLSKTVLVCLMMAVALSLTHCGKGDNRAGYIQKPLPYDMGALEPYISKQAMVLHYEKHHAGYVAKTNQLLKDFDLDMSSPATLLQEIGGKKKYSPLFNVLAQALNHDFYWECLSPDGGNMPEGKLRDLIKSSFGSVAAFKEAFVDAAVKQFGSGWVWLVKDGETLIIETTGNADTPVAHGKKSVFVVDVWEHAYYPDYQNRRKVFVQTILDKLANWSFVESQL